MTDTSAGYRFEEPPIPNRLLNAGDIVGGSFRTLMRNPTVFLALPLIAVAALLIPTIIAVGLVLALTGTGGSEGVLLLALLLFPLGIYVLMRTAGAVSIGAYRVALGESVTLRQVWAEASGVVWRMVTLALLVAGVAIAFFLAIFFLVLALSAASTDAAAAVVVVLVLLAFPLYLFVGVKLAYVMSAIAIEKAGPVEAIRRSIALSRGFFWATLGRIILLWLLSVPISIISNLVVTPFGIVSDGDDFSGGMIAVIVLSAVVYLLLSFVYQALAAIYLTIMYIDVRRREDQPAFAPADVYGGYTGVSPQASSGYGAGLFGPGYSDAPASGQPGGPYGAGSGAPGSPVQGAGVYGEQPYGAQPYGAGHGGPTYGAGPTVPSGAPAVPPVPPAPAYSGSTTPAYPDPPIPPAYPGSGTPPTPPAYPGSGTPPIPPAYPGSGAPSTYSTGSDPLSAPSPYPAGEYRPDPTLHLPTAEQQAAVDDEAGDDPAGEGSPGDPDRRR